MSLLFSLIIIHFNKNKFICSAEIPLIFRLIFYYCVNSFGLNDFLYRFQGFFFSKVLHSSLMWEIFLVGGFHLSELVLESYNTPGGLEETFGL